ncbi:MAG: ankyrin repeat domain-containing protein [Azonexus sp.]|nr:ankyrin repeat domain-containing protein [Azonexus sp.]MBE7421594.1 ankyrin repeat domain-containing protein [Zoogloeaceae bacterium]MCK6385949.1 ankyrin repeat domain-containing protein [Rhodocyclaceae bacterium]MCK6413909.1 ankyrin repeat domain-containing protein [Azonexus sp.]
MIVWRNVINTMVRVKFIVNALLSVALGALATLAYAQTPAPLQPQTLEQQLFRAVYSKDEAKAIALIEAGANVDAREATIYVSLPILYRATERGMKEVVQALVMKGANVNAEVEHYRGIPLTIALAHGYEDIARFLIDHGANVNYADKAGYTMLHVAAGRVSKSMLEFLINYGLNVNANDNGVGTPLYYAIRAENWQNARLLIDRGADFRADIGRGDQALSMAAKYGGFELVKFLVAKGADVRARNFYTGGTALHEAAAYGYKDIVEFLISEGADVNASGVPKNSPYRILSTPIVGPAYRGHFDIVKILVNHGADVNFHGEGGLTPLGMAAFGGHRLIAEWLVNHGAEINPFAKDYELEANNIPLLSAVDRRDIEMVRFLIAKGARVNARAKGGETALLLARRFRRQDIVDLLVANGATD